jgi:sugar/nucleoside kinase (ribokinase family)
MADVELPPVIVAGSIVLDIFPPLILPEGKLLSEFLIGGQVIETGPLEISPGGVVPNTGFALHKLGIPVLLMGRLGADLLGHAVRSSFERHDITSQYISEVSGSSAYSIVLAPPATDRIFLNYPGLNTTFSADDINWDMVQKAGVLHIGYPPLLPMLIRDAGKPLAALLARAKQLGVTTSVDMCLVGQDSEAARQDWHPILQQALPYVDIFMPGVEEMLYLVDRDLFESLRHKAAGRAVLSAVEPQHMMDLMDTLISMGTGIVGLKAGEKGLYLRTADSKRLARFGRSAPAEPQCWANRELWEPGYQPRRIVTAVGAGDSAVAGFLTAFLRGHSIEECLRFSCAVGTISLEAADATAAVRSWDDTVARLSSPWPKTKLRIEHPGWGFDDDLQQWRGPRDTNGRGKRSP